MSEHPHPFDTSHPLRTRAVLRAATAVYRRRFRRVAATAALVYVPTSLLEALSHSYLEHAVDRGVGVGAILLIGVCVAFFASFGDVFFTGVMDGEVGADLRGEQVPDLGDAIRHIPYGKLLVADLLFGVLLIVLSIGFFMPALIGFTAFCLVGPVINIERRGVLEGFRRSATLVRRAIGATLLLVVLPNLVESQLEPLLLALPGNVSLLVFLGVNIVFAIVVGGFLGVVDITLAHVLIARDQGARARSRRT